MSLSLRLKANRAKLLRCKTLIAVLENPKTIENIGSVVRNVDALGVSKLYVIDGYNLLPDEWSDMRDRKSLNKISVSAIKWAYVRKFQTTQSCLQHLCNEKYVSMVTSPHQKGKNNVILEEGKYTHPRLAVWFGNETTGISQEAVNAAEVCINIPMCGIIESLNLGTCTGIVLYEIAKQRRKFKMLKGHLDELWAKHQIDPLNFNCYT